MFLWGMWVHKLVGMLLLNPERCLINYNQEIVRYNELGVLIYMVMPDENIDTHNSFTYKLTIYLFTRFDKVEVCSFVR